MRDLRGCLCPGGCCSAADNVKRMMVWRGTPHLASVYLCVVCLLGLTAAPISHDGITQVKTLLDSQNVKSLDCKLYTPTVPDFQKCPVSTMRCFTDEVKVLMQELTTADLSTRVSKTLHRSLQMLTRTLTQPEMQCLQCEYHEESNVEIFLRALQSTLQMMNSNNS